MGKYLATGNDIFAARYGLLFILNQSQENWIADILYGLLESASKAEAWDPIGETTPEEAAKYFYDLIDRIQPMLFMIGMIADFPVILDTDTGWLPCDGALYYQADYPDLYAVIGDTFDEVGDPSDQFRVPDIRGRVRVASDDGAGRNTQSWASTVGGAGGEESHTLVTSETPSHSHTDTGHTHADIPAIASVAQAPVLPVPAAIPGVGVTGVGNANLTSAGGDGAHNNLQPSIVFYPHIFAEF